MTHRRTVTVTVALLIAAAVPLGAFAIGPVTAQEMNETPIDSCTTITQPGTYTISDGFYANNTNQSVNGSTAAENVSACIVVASDDVTLDGDNATISGTVGMVESMNNTTTNATTNDSVHTIGVVVLGDDVTVENLDVTSFDAGVVFAGTTNGTLENVDVSANERAGVVFANATNVSASNVTANDIVGAENDSAFSGAFVFYNASNNTVENSSATGAQNWTVYAQGQSNNTVENISVDDTTFSAEFDSANVRPATDFPPAPEGFVVVSGPLEAANVSNGSALNLTFNYADSQVEMLGVDETSLNVYTVSNGSWVPVDDAVIDVTENTGTVTVNDSGTYALVGETTADNATVDNATTDNDTVVPAPTDDNETPTATPTPDNVTETPTATPTPDNDTATPTETPTPDNVTETPTATPTPDNVTETPTATPTPDNDTATPTPDNATATESPGNETATESPGNATVTA
jgi:hypothetical protein